MKTASNRRATTIFALAFSTLILLGSCVAEPAHAYTPQQMALCSLVEASATVTMSRRQRGMDLEMALTYAKEDGSGIALGQVYDAWDYPVHKKDQEKRYEIARFARAWYTECLKAAVAKSIKEY